VISIVTRREMKALPKSEGSEGSMEAEAFFEQLEKETGKHISALRGFRLREEMTQEELAEKIKIKQGDLSKMENGTRPIGKEIAKRLAKVFHTDYRVFL
jgi:ribosome-binding protein aMBF1 (putative translation factor)